MNRTAEIEVTLEMLVEVQDPQYANHRMEPISSVLDRFFNTLTPAPFSEVFDVTYSVIRLRRGRST